MTKKEIILETVEYYKTHNRGLTILNGGALCAYFGNRGDMCAVGRCLINPKKIQTLDFNMGDNVTADINKVSEFINIEDELKPEYRGHSLKFWSELQHFHDYSFYWEKKEIGNGLESSGSIALKTLLEKYENL